MVDIYMVEFDCEGPDGTASASVEVNEVSTTEIVPLAMGRLHKLFVALAKQTAAWLTEKS